MTPDNFCSAGFFGTVQETNADESGAVGIACGVWRRGHCHSMILSASACGAHTHATMHPKTPQVVWSALAPLHEPVSLSQTGLTHHARPCVAYTLTHRRIAEFVTFPLHARSCLGNATERCPTPSNAHALLKYLGTTPNASQTPPTGRRWPLSTDHSPSETNKDHAKWPCRARQWFILPRERLKRFGTSKHIIYTPLEPLTPTQT
jgi:hypothetical protein